METLLYLFTVETVHTEKIKKTGLSGFFFIWQGNIQQIEFILSSVMKRHLWHGEGGKRADLASIDWSYKNPSSQAFFSQETANKLALNNRWEAFTRGNSLRMLSYLDWRCSHVKKQVHSGSVYWDKCKCNNWQEEAVWTQYCFMMLPQNAQNAPKSPSSTIKTLTHWTIMQCEHKTTQDKNANRFSHLQSKTVPVCKSPQKSLLQRDHSHT